MKSRIKSMLYLTSSQAPISPYASLPIKQ
jgi:hypothetical protein